MQIDVLVHHLHMIVDPSDSSYMPSLVVLSGGPTLSSMKELATIVVGQNDSTVHLLCEQTEVKNNCFSGINRNLFNIPCVV